MTSAGSRRAAAPQRRDRRLVGVAVALVIVLGVAGVVLLVRDGEADRAGDRTSATPGGPSGSPTDDTDGGEQGPDPLDDPLSAESLDLRYAALAGSVTTGASDCHRGKKRDGQRERIVCDVAAGTLELVTYRTGKDLRARREKAVTDEPGSVLDPSGTGTLMAFQSPAPAKPRKPAKPKPSAAGPVTFLYWDVDAERQSATYTSRAGGDLDRLVESYDATGPTRPYPAGPSDAGLVRFTERWVDPEECVRTVTVNPGALEESYCDVGGPVEVFLGRFATLEQLKAYRKIIVASAIADDRDLRDWRRRQGGDPTGALYEYTTDDKTVSRYWDDTACLCYAEAFRADGTYAQLARWWDRT